MPSESIYIAGFVVLVAGLICALGGATSMGVAGALGGGLLWALARFSRDKEIRNRRACYGADPGPQQDIAGI